MASGEPEEKQWRVPSGKWRAAVIWRPQASQTLRTDMTASGGMALNHTAAIVALDYNFGIDRLGQEVI